MKRWLTALSGAAMALCTTLATADSEVGSLVHQLGEGDFRVRLQAALELGKSDGSEVRRALEQALGDTHASVRLAAAAALEVLGDPGALDALRACSDNSAAVMRQVNRTIEALEVIAQAQQEATILVQLGKMKNATNVDADSALRHLRSESRRNLTELPGVAVIVGTPIKGKPVVLLTGQIAQLSAKRNGESIVYSAKVEYIVHRMPEQSITAAVSGSAMSSISVSAARDKRRAAEVRATVLEAAVASAVRSVRPALEAAASR